MTNAIRSPSVHCPVVAVSERVAVVSVCEATAALSTTGSGVSSTVPSSSAVVHAAIIVNSIPTPISSLVFILLFICGEG